MNRIVVDLGPQQEIITEEKIRRMVQLKPRRMKISTDFPDRYGIKAPFNDGGDWSVLFPFSESYKNAFEAMSPAGAHIGIRLKDNGRCYTFLRDTSLCQESPEAIAQVCNILGKYVAIRDCLSLSFALDYDHVDGDPAKVYSEVGRLRNLAKPRDGSTPSAENYKIGGKGLANLCLTFLDEMVCYRSVDCVVAMPASNPDKPLYLPRNLSNIFAKHLKIQNLSEHVRTIKKRKQLKETTIDERLDAIKDTIKVDGGVFNDKIVLLIDDVYQSGISINYVAMMLQRAGARKIYGLSCDKTCSNTDNIG